MNEQLFIPRMDVLQLARTIASNIEASTLARRLLAFSASVAVHLAAAAILQWNAAVQYAPPGEVVVMQIEGLVEVRVAQN